MFVPPTPPDGTCIPVQPNTTFSGNIIAQSNCPGGNIVDINTQSPSGLYRSMPQTNTSAGTLLISISWTPLPSQVGSNLFCYTAIDSSGARSDQSCLNLLVGANSPPRVVDRSQYPFGQVELTDTGYWRVNFDRPIARPASSSYIRLFTADGNQVFAINTAVSNDVQFVSNSNESYIAFTTTYAFIAGVTYFVTLDNGVAKGVGVCALDSVGVFDQMFWRIQLPEPPTPSTTNPPTTTTATTTVTATSTSKPECWTQWSEWTSCSRTCGVGIRFRERTSLTNSKSGDDNIEKEPCNMSGCTDARPGRACSKLPWLCGKKKSISININLDGFLDFDE